MAKRVDFSLGMKDVNSMADPYEDRSPSQTQFRNVIRESNRIEEERRESEQGRESSEVVRASGRSASRRDRSGSGSHHHIGSGFTRRSTEPFGPHRNSVSSVGTHRNRFMGWTRGNHSMDRARDVEEGDTRSNGSQDRASVEPSCTIGFNHFNYTRVTRLRIGASHLTQRRLGIKEAPRSIFFCQKGAIV